MSKQYGKLVSLEVGGLDKYSGEEREEIFKEIISFADIEREKVYAALDLQKPDKEILGSLRWDQMEICKRTGLNIRIAIESPKEEPPKKTVVYSQRKYTTEGEEIYKEYGDGNFLVVKKLMSNDGKENYSFLMMKSNGKGKVKTTKGIAESLSELENKLGYIPPIYLNNN